MEILIDFDFSCVIPNYPEFIDIGAQRVLRRLVDEGHNLILFTCRSDQPFHLPDGTVDYNGLTDALNWFKRNDIPLYGIQYNPTQHEFTTSNKAFGHLLIDDTALGAPTLRDHQFTGRLYIDWVRAEQMLEESGVLKTK